MSFESFALPVPPLETQPETAFVWEAMRQGEILLPHCNACGFVIWFPRPYCPECSSLDVRWEAASGRGVVYSFTVNRRGHAYNRVYDGDSYVVAYVELAEGPRVLTNIVGCPLGDVRVGMPVTAEIHQAGDDVILRFRPDPAFSIATEE